MSSRPPRPLSHALIVTRRQRLDHGLPDGKASQAKPVPGPDGCGPEVRLVVDRSTRALTGAWLLHRNPLTRLPASSPLGVKCAHTPARRSSSGEMNTCIEEPATWPQTRQRTNGRHAAEVECIVDRSRKPTLAH